ncbi:MAG: DNA repair protein RadC [Chloroflexota bacterium]
MELGGYHTLIKELPEGERPRERLQQHGAGMLSNAELIAIALRTGTHRDNAVGLAQHLLKRFGGLAGIARASVTELCDVPGIGPAKAAQVQAALELGRRLILAGGDARPQITSPEDAAVLLSAQMAHQPQEQLRVLLLDTKHYVQRDVLLYTGNVNTSLIRIGEVFRDAVKENATAIVVGHNHPSGDPTPSPEDVRVTQEIVRAGQLLDIKVLDHIIVGDQRYVSLKEKGLGF